MKFFWLLEQVRRTKEQVRSARPKCSAKPAIGAQRRVGAQCQGLGAQHQQDDKIFPLFFPSFFQNMIFLPLVLSIATMKS